jgi:hypothetical protein
LFFQISTEEIHRYVFGEAIGHCCRHIFILIGSEISRVWKTGIYAPVIDSIREDTVTKNITSIKVEKTTRDRLRLQKTGGETYDELINKMVEQYDTEVAN